MEVYMKKKSYKALLEKPPSFFFSPETKVQASNLVKKFIDSWRLLCKHHFNYVPTLLHDPESAYHSCHYWNQYKETKSTRLRKNYLSQAAKLGHYQALKKEIGKKLNTNSFSKAFELAKKASTIYRAPGFLLLGDCYYKKAMQNELTPDERKESLLEAIIHDNIAITLIQYSRLSLSISKLKIDKNMREARASRLEEIRQNYKIILDKKDLEHVNKETNCRAEVIIKTFKDNEDGPMLTCEIEQYVRYR